MKLKLLFHPWFWRDLKWDIQNFFNPRQKWLTKEIPNGWCDKVELIPRLLFRMLTHFVEEEMDNVSWDWSDEVKAGYMTQEIADKVAQTKRDIMEVYDYIKNQRPQLEKDVEDSYPPIRDDIFTKDEDDFTMIGNMKCYRYNMETTEEEKKAYEKIRAIEEKISDLDMWAMNLIIKHHKSLWT